MALPLVLIADRRLEGFLFFGGPCLVRALDAIAFHRGQHRRRLLAAHHRNARVWPHPQKARAIGTAAHGVVAGAEAAADYHREFRHVRTGHRCHHLGAVFGDAGLLVFLADHEAGDVLQKHQRHVALITQLDKVRTLERAFGEQDAVIGNDADRIAVNMRETADQGLAVARFEFVQLRAVDDARNHLANVERLARVLRNHAVEFVDGILWLSGRLQRERYMLFAIEAGDDIASDRERVRVVLGIVIRNAGNGRMDVRTPERFGIDHFTRCCFYQRRPAEEDRALLAHDDGLVAHRRHIRAAGGARAHHHRDLRNVQCRHARLIVEDAAEVLAIGKHLVLQWQECAAGVDQVDAGQMVFQRHFLRAKMFFHGHRKIRAALDRRVIGDNQDLDAIDATDTGDDAGGGRRAVIHAVCGQRRQFEKRRSWIEQGSDAFAWQQLAAGFVFFARLGSAAFGAAQQFALQVIGHGTQL